MYLKVLFSTFILVVSLIGYINWVIDPYRVFFTSDIENVNIIKPQAQEQIYFNRARGIVNANAEILLLGNSRIHWGFHAESKVWTNDGKPSVYNAAIAGGNIRTSYEYLKFATENSDLKKAYIGIDYYNFIGNHVKSDPSTSLATVIGDYPKFLNAGHWALYKELLIRVFSIDAFWDSLVTIFNQNNQFSQNINKKGDNTVQEYNAFVNEKGHHRLFQNNLNGMSKKLKGPLSVFDQYNSSPDFETFKRMLKFGVDNNIQLVILIHPYHNSLIRQLNEYERMLEFKNWKTELTKIVNDYKGVTLWDFSEKSEITSEVIPSKGEKTPMQWYWEAGHYKNTLGDEMIKVTLGSEEAKKNFGRLLSTNN